MTTGLTDRGWAVKRGTQIFPTYTETFDEFSEAMCKTDFLKEEEKFIIRKLLKQWRMNKNVIR